jgi:hypothetical protein
MCILQESGSRKEGGGPRVGQGRRLLNEGDEGVYQLVPSGPVVAGNVHAPDVVPAGRNSNINQGQRRFLKPGIHSPTDSDFEQALDFNSRRSRFWQENQERFTKMDCRDAHWG